MLPLLLPVSHSDTLFSSPTNASTFNIDRQKLPVRKAADRPKSSRHDSLDNSAAINAIPLPPPAPTLLAELTPCHEQYPDLASVQFQQSLDLPVSPSTGAPLIPKSMRELRLPSFDALGITASVPEVSSTDPSVHQPNVDLTVKNADLPHIRNASLSCPSALPPSPLSDAALEHQHPQPVPAGYRPVNSFVLTHTPPDDTGVIDWGLPNAKSSAEPSHEQSTRSETSSISPSGVTSVSARGASLGMADQPSALYNSGKAPWLNHALESILDIVYKHNRSDAIKILSHALPSPSANGHAFPHVIEAIQTSTSSSSIMWMNVWHAVSGRFKFEDLPKSPPTTPAPPHEGDDYFTQRVFDYAVEVPDYSQKLVAQPLTPRPQRPAIAPNSIDISIVERYIPPTSAAEFEELFSATGRSFLNDRLIELSPAHGTLLFIYPTKAGGQTFLKKYLDPILAPTLRVMMGVYELPQHLVEAVGRMDAIPSLPTFEDMKSQLLTFLNTLSNGGGSTPNRFRLQGSTYELMHAAPELVPLDREVWAKDWWTKQEKLRIQRTFEAHDVQSATRTRQAGAFSAAEHVVMATLETQQAAQSNQGRLLHHAETQSLLREAERSRGERHPGNNEQMILNLMQEVISRRYRDGPPEVGVEVGVFVIQKRPRSTVS